jgi:hypothetical protein
LKSSSKTLGILFATLLLTSSFVQLSRGADKPWPPPGGAPLTKWGKDISMDKPVWPEYPRPQLVRDQWQNLNGPWDYSIVDKDAAQPTTYDGKILVPFPPQSVLSQVNKPAGKTTRIWYHRSFQIPPTWNGHRILLHFGAVNWETHAFVNGKEVGTHTGGYDPFTFDITDALGSGDQQLVVSAWNPVEGGQPRGKQSTGGTGIFYTPTTGIWQTAWLEPVPGNRIASIKMIPDIDAKELKLTVITAGYADGKPVEAVVMDGTTEVARVTGRTNETFSIPIPQPKLWWPTSPFLYNIKIDLKDGDKVGDSVTSYFGMRKISVGPDKSGRMHMLLNNTFIFELGFLDQGFWPDGVYTAPSDDAMKSDLEATKAIGFNMIRKHIKVEPARYYYWTDKLGILVWQDMPAAGEMGDQDKPTTISDPEGNFESELRRMVRTLINHPSIVVWIPFNEGWGLQAAEPKHPKDDPLPSEITKFRETRMVDTIREEDPSRLIDPESGAGGGDNQGKNFWDIGLGDIIDFHCYGGDAPKPEAHRASVIGEAGWGSAPEASLGPRLKTSQDLGDSGLVITQTTDVENETNGALKYDRTPKFPLDVTGKKIIDMMHKAGYDNYPGGDPADAASTSTKPAANP